MKKVFLSVIIGIFFFFAGILLIPGIRGTNNDLRYYQQSKNREVGGPFESSGSTSRYLLTETIAEDRRIYFSQEEAEFASPDVVGKDGKYFSIFMPGVSFVGVPFFKLGEVLGAGQIGSYLMNTLVAMINVLLIFLIVRKKSNNNWVGLFSGLVFLFGSNAFAYSFFYTQHHLSTLCLLIGIYLVTFDRNFINNLLLGAIYGYAIMIDIPNIFIMFPLLIFAFSQHFKIKKAEQSISLSLKYSFIYIAIGAIPLLAGIGLYNYSLTKNYTKLPQFIGRTETFSQEQRKAPIKTTVKEKDPFEVNTPFLTRNLLNGLYILLISDERGWLVYSPILFIGFLGVIAGLKKKHSSGFIQTLFSIFIVNLLLYAMFGDPWGGWSFGPRYMIPAAAVMSVLIGYATFHYRKNILYVLFVVTLIAYSSYINTLGAITTTEVPPKQEAAYLTSHIPYTYKYNLSLLKENKIRSFFYTSSLVTVISAFDFFIIYWSVILMLLSFSFSLAIIHEKDKET